MDTVMDEETKSSKKTGWAAWASTFALRGSGKPTTEKYSGWKVYPDKNRKGRLVTPLRYVVIKGGKLHTTKRFDTVKAAHQYIQANYEKEG